MRRACQGQKLPQRASTRRGRARRASRAAGVPRRDRRPAAHQTSRAALGAQHIHVRSPWLRYRNGPCPVALVCQSTSLWRAPRTVGARAFSPHRRPCAPSAGPPPAFSPSACPPRFPSCSFGGQEGRAGNAWPVVVPSHGSRWPILIQVMGCVGSLDSPAALRCATCAKAAGRPREGQREGPGCLR
jgi:hypothetical protein